MQEKNKETQRSFFKSIQGKIIIQMMLVSLIPIIIIAAMVYVSMLDSQQSASDSVDETWDEMQEKVVAVSLANQAEAMALELTGSVGDQVLDLVKIMATPTITGLAMGMGDASIAEMYLNGQLKISDQYQELTITDTDGTILATTNPQMSAGDSVSSQTWWEAESFISMMLNEEKQTLEMALWLPIVNPFNMEEELGRIVGVSRSDSESSSVTYAEQLEQGRMSIFYGGKLIIDTGDPSRSFRDDVVLSFVEQSAFSAVREADDAVAGDSLPTVSGFIADDEAGIVAGYFRAGAEDIAAIMPTAMLGMNDESLSSDSTRDQSAIIVMQQPKEIAFAPVAGLKSLEDDLNDKTNATIVMLVGILAIVTLIVLGVAVWLSRVITNPIMNLHRGVEYVMKGNLEHRINSEATDEVGQVSRAFDQMTESMQKSQKELKEANETLESTVKEQTQELNAAIEKMQVIFESMSDGVAVVDMTGTISEANAALAKMHNFNQKEQVIGVENLKLIAEKDRDRVLQDMGETFETRTAALREYTMLRNDGSEYEAEMATVALSDGDGNPVGAMAVIRDVTERKLAEQQILQAKKQLEDYAHELERSNKELDDFAYIASHDLKEPLRGIYNYSSFLIEDYGDNLDEEGQSKLQTLMRLAQRLEAFLNDLLYYSRAGRAKLDKQETDSSEIIKEVLDTLESSITEHGTTINVASDMPVVVCDRVKVSEVFSNLMTNAIKFNDKDEKWVELGWQKGEDENPVFFVRDNGIGIKEKNLNKVFKIFTRLHAREKYGGGTGSGLTMTRKIIHLHGGDIWVESELEKGTTFYFTLTKKGEDHR